MTFDMEFPVRNHPDIIDAQVMTLLKQMTKTPTIHSISSHSGLKRDEVLSSILRIAHKSVRTQCQ